MKKSIILLFILAAVSAGHAQDTTRVKTKRSTLSHFQFYTDVNLDQWMNNPDSIKSKLLKSRGAGVYMRYDVPFSESHFGFSPAIGICSYNLGTNGTVNYMVDTVTLKTNTVFNILSGSYKINKLVANYAEIPVEFYYTSKTKIPLRIALGFKGGYLVSSHTKYKKDSSTKYKMYDIKNVSQYRYGATIHATYGWFGVSGFYSLTPLFESGLGPDATPFSVGITIAPY